MIVLSCMDLDLALRKEKPAALTDESSDMDVKNFEQWERYNRMSLMIIKHSIPETIRGAVPEVDNAKAFLQLQNVSKRMKKQKLVPC